MATRLIVNLIGFISTIVLSRLLFPADFGLVAIAVTVQALVGSITELSTGSAIIRHDNPLDQHFDSVFTLSIIRSAIIALLLAIAANFVAGIYGDKRLVGIMFALSATTFLGGFFNPKIALFSRNFVFWQEFALAVPQKLLGLIVAVAIAVIYQSYWALIIGGAAAQILGVILSFVLLPYLPKLRLTEGREFLSFSVWVILERAVGALNVRAGPLLIGYMLGNIQLGYFAFGDNLAALPTREATAPVSGVLFPAFSRMKADTARLREAYQRAQTLLCAIALPVGFGFAAVAHPLILLAVGPKWLPSVIVVQILAGVFAIDTLWASVWPVVLALGETRELFRRELINLAIRLPLIALGVFAGGLIGVLIARLISGLVMMLLNLSLINRLIALPVQTQLAANWRTIVGTIVMTSVVAAFQSVGLEPDTSLRLAIFTAGLIAIGAIVYVVTITSLWLWTGRPAGPEATVYQVLKGALAALRARYAADQSGQLLIARKPRR